MEKFFAKILLTAVAVLAVSYWIPGISVSNFYIAIVVAIVFGLLSLVVRPILVILTLPLSILTLGLFTLVINGLLFWFASTFIKGFAVTGFWPAFLGALCLSTLNYFIERIIK